MDSHVQGEGPGCPSSVDDPGELPTSSHHATAKALTQGKLTIETVSQATETLSSYISALDDQGWDVKQEVLAKWLKEEEGSEHSWPTAFHGKTRQIENERDGEVKHLTVSVVKTSIEEFEKDHCRENVGKFVLTTHVNNSADDDANNYDRHCMYASQRDEGKIMCPTNGPGTTTDRGTSAFIELSNSHSS